jgi:hypothetical protein
MSALPRGAASRGNSFHLKTALTKSESPWILSSPFTKALAFRNALIAGHSPQICPNTAENSSRTDISKSYDKMKSSSPSISLSPLKSLQGSMLT